MSKKYACKNNLRLSTFFLLPAFFLFSIFLSLLRILLSFHFSFFFSIFFWVFLNFRSILLNIFWVSRVGRSSTRQAGEMRGAAFFAAFALAVAFINVTVPEGSTCCSWAGGTLWISGDVGFPFQKKNVVFDLWSLARQKVELLPLLFLNNAEIRSRRLV